MSISKKPSEEFVVVRHRPGHKLRRFLVMLVVTVMAALIGYAAGSTLEGFRLSDVTASRDELKTELRELRSRYAEASQQLVNLERGRTIDQQALAQTRRTIARLETQISSLKADLTFYKNIMAPSETSTGLQVDRFTVSRARQDGAYNFKLVLTQVGNNKNYISGMVAVNVIGSRNGEKEVVALRDLSDDIEDLGVKFRFRYFQDIDGLFALPEGFEPLEVQVVAQAEGKKSTQAERTFDWGSLTEK